MLSLAAGVSSAGQAEPTQAYLLRYSDSCGNSTLAQTLLAKLALQPVRSHAADTTATH